MQKRIKGFTLVELLVGLVVGGVLILMIGVLSSASMGSYQAMGQEANLYNDICYGFQLMEHCVRQSNTVNADVTNNILTAGNFIFKKNNLDFMYTDTSTNTDYILVPSASTLNFTLSKDITGQLITINLSGQKGKVAFNLSTKVKRRN